MPQRTNDFQKLVLKIQAATAPRGSTVIESAMVSTPHLRWLREIDVLVTYDDASFYKLRIAVEAKDLGRKLSVEQLDTILGKYRVKGSVATDRVILITRRGFSDAATAKARLNGIELFTLDVAEKLDWRPYFPPHFQVLPKSIRVDAPPEFSNICIGAARPFTREQIINSRIICRCCGQQFGSLNQWLYDKLPKTNDFQQWLAQEDAIPTRRLSCDISKLIAVLPDNSTLDLLTFECDVQRVDGILELDFKTYQLQGDQVKTQIVHEGRGTLNGRSVEFFVGPDANVINFNLGFNAHGTMNDKPPKKQKRPKAN